MGRRLRTFGWVLIVVLVVTGAANCGFTASAGGPAASAILGTNFGRALGYKLALVRGLP